jgi:omega-6 fatty acid desaturase (delta-12 desaturase)
MPPESQPLEPARIRADIPASLRARGVVSPLALFAVVAGTYAASWLAIFEVPATPIAVAAAVLNGLFVGLLFVIGHDACHGSFLPWKWANAALGRVAFLPSLHPYALWEVGHNRLHHGWTNLKGKDYVWIPFSPTEFKALSLPRRLFERFGRTFAGAGVHYAALIWWPHMILPRAEDRRLVAPGAAVLDRLAIGVFLAAQLALGARLAAGHGLGAAAALSRTLVLGVFVPFGTFCWLIGVITFVQHNHVRVRWYDRREEWSFADGSLRGTVRAVPTKALDSLLLNIMAHTAHHVDTRVPLYRLARAQELLERAYPDVVREPWTVAFTFEMFRSCKLYDYRSHAWLDFSGRPVKTRQRAAAPPVAAETSAAAP